MTSEKIKKDLDKIKNKEKAQILMRFFKTGPGQYGQGDVFLGISVPELRKIARIHQDAGLPELQKLLKSKIHEHRLTALLILAYKYPCAENSGKKQICKFYLKNSKHINNWDLVDATAPRIVGAYLLDNQKEIDIIYKLARSQNLWERRIGVLASYPFIKAHDFAPTLKISKILLKDPHDLIHKAVGWMLREVGKIDQEEEEKFLRTHYQKMPRTMLRYAIEKFGETKRKKYLNNQI